MHEESEEREVEGLNGERGLKPSLAGVVRLAVFPTAVGLHIHTRVLLIPLNGEIIE